jgi:hypothetical protein
MKFNGALDQVDALFRGKLNFLANCETMPVDRESLILATRCRRLVWQLAALARVLHLSLPLLFTLRRLDMFESSFAGERRDDPKLLETLLLFTT